MSKHVIGLTGNIAVGKTTVCNILLGLGAQIIDADSLVHGLLRRGQAVHEQVVAAFGASILRPDGEIDRPALGRIVFADAAALARLEAIVHPAVEALIQAEIAASSAPVIVVDAVKLIESGLSARCDAVWVVTAQPEQQLARLTQQRGLSPADAWQRINAQPPQERKIAQADVVIDNSGDIAATEAQVRAAWGTIGHGLTRKKH